MPRIDEGQGSLACSSPRGCKELDTTEQLKNNHEGGGYGMNPGGSQRHGGSHDEGHKVDHRQGHQGKLRGRGSVDIDWI